MMASLNVFGFLGGKEVKDAGLGNIGLHDRTYSSQYRSRVPRANILPHRTGWLALGERIYLGLRR